MDFLRAGETLLRSSQPLLPFLTPSACTSACRSTTARRLAVQRTQPLRTLTTTPALRAGNSSNNDTDDFTALLNSTLDHTKGTPTAPSGRTSRFGSPRAQQSNRLSPSPSARVSDELGSSMDDILADLHGRRTPTNTRARNTSAPSISALDYATALDPLGHYSNKPREPDKLPEPPVKLNSSVGRTILVDQARGMDVGKAFRQLEIRCATNSVKKDFNRQRFHERPGLKRKRLKSERWRRNFKEAFRGTIKLVQGLKKQGW